MAGAAEECPVCLVRKALRVASCKSRHCFCTDCLEHLARKHGTLFPCPMCRQPLQIPRSGVSAFPFQFTQKPGSFNLDSVIAGQLHMKSVLALAHDGDSAVSHDGNWLFGSEGAESLAVDGAEEDSLQHNEDGLSSFEVAADYGSSISSHFDSDCNSEQPQSRNYWHFAVEGDSANEGQGSRSRKESVQQSLDEIWAAGGQHFPLTGGMNKEYPLPLADKAARFLFFHEGQRQQRRDGTAACASRDSDRDVALKIQRQLDAELLADEGDQELARLRMLEMKSALSVGKSAKRGSNSSSSSSTTTNGNKNTSRPKQGKGGESRADRDRQVAERLQEEMDRETARQLDKELNGGGAAGFQTNAYKPAHDPPAWPLRPNVLEQFQRLSVALHRNKPPAEEHRFQNLPGSAQGKRPSANRSTLLAAQERGSFHPGRAPRASQAQAERDQALAQRLQEDQIRGASRTLQAEVEDCLYGALLGDRGLARKLQAEEQRKKEQYERDRALARRLQDERQFRQNGLGFNGRFFGGFD